MTATKHQVKANQAAVGKKRKNPQQQPGEAALSHGTKQTRRSVRTSPNDVTAVLSQRALAGDTESARLLLNAGDRAKPATPPKKKRRRGLTYAQQLALDPPWPGKLPPPFVSIYDKKPQPL